MHSECTVCRVWLASMSRTGTRLRAMHDKSMPSSAAGNRETSCYCGLSNKNGCPRTEIGSVSRSHTDKRLFCGGNTARTMHATAFVQTSC
jgi:hypothetical protein